MGYRGLFKKFNVDGALIHTMMKREHRTVRLVTSLDENVYSSSSEQEEDFSGVASLYPPRHVHHLSFWLSDSVLRLDEGLILRVLEVTGLRPLVTRCDHLQLYTDPGGRRSQTLEIEMCDLQRPLGHTRALHLLTNVLAKSLENCFSVIRR